MMARPWSRLFALAAALCLAGCAKLNVTVDVLDPAFVRENVLEASLRGDGVRLLGGDLTQGATLRTRLEAEYADAHRRATRILVAAAQASSLSRTNQEAVADLIGITRDAGCDPDYATDMGRLDREVLRILRSKGASLGQANLRTPPQLTPELRAALVQRQTRMSELAACYAEKVGALARSARTIAAALQAAQPNATSVQQASSAPSPLVAAEAAKAAKKIDAVVVDKQTDVRRTAQQTITSGGETLARNDAAFLATSPHSEPYWARRYNQALALGTGGGTDIAIRLNSAADFSIKGMAFDARTTAQLMTKVGARAVSTIAAYYGAPFVRTTSGGTATTKFDPTKSVSEATSALASDRAQNAAYRADLFRVADSVFTNVGTGQTLDGAPLAAVRATITARGDRWKGSEDTGATSQGEDEE